MHGRGTLLYNICVQNGWKLERVRWESRFSSWFFWLSEMWTYLIMLDFWFSATIWQFSFPRPGMVLFGYNTITHSLTQLPFGRFSPSTVLVCFDSSFSFIFLFQGEKDFFFPTILMIVMSRECSSCWMRLQKRVTNFLRIFLCIKYFSFWMSFVCDNEIEIDFFDLNWSGLLIMERVFVRSDLLMLSMENSGPQILIFSVPKYLLWQRSLLLYVFDSLFIFDSVKETFEEESKEEEGFDDNFRLKGSFALLLKWLSDGLTIKTNSAVCTSHSQHSLNRKFSFYYYWLVKCPQVTAINYNGDIVRVKTSKEVHFISFIYFGHWDFFLCWFSSSGLVVGSHISLHSKESLKLLKTLFFSIGIHCKSCDSRSSSHCVTWWRYHIHSWTAQRKTCSCKKNWNGTCDESTLTTLQFLISLISDL